MNKINLRENQYTIIENYKDAFDESSFKEICTDYFDEYDYLIGDIAYGKVRLKGFYDTNNKKKNKINDYKDKDKYLKENCAVDCRYFILKKEK